MISIKFSYYLFNINKVKLKYNYYKKGLFNV